MISSISSITLISFLLFAPTASAQQYPQLTYRYDHHLFTLNPNAYPQFRTTKEVWLHNGEEILVPQRLRVDGDTLPGLPSGVTRSVQASWNTDAIAQVLAERISSSLDREPGSVTIRTQSGATVFDGVGMLGRRVDTATAARLTIEALEQGVFDIHLPVEELQPVIVVEDSALRNSGIREVVAVGESNFMGSPAARKHNIRTGLAKFNGHRIAQGETFSFNDVLGPVNGQTGYVKELVIMGEKTLPDYGGGLCQISTTAYRGIWEYGFPIADRRNHSFSVQYYAPQGTDATIYPPHTDMKFINDSPGDLLIQTHAEDEKAYFIYYGTRDSRKTEIVGPYIWNRRSPPPDRTEYTTDIPVGTTRSVGKAVDGLQAAWFRILRSEEGEEVIEPVYSYYEARPNFTQIGGAPQAPAWIGVDE